MPDAPSFPTVPLLVTGSEADAGLRGGPIAPDLAIGAPRRIGSYDIIGGLGTGGMGVVYRAEQHEPLRRTVALKLVRRGLDIDRLIARFDAKRQALARMSHSGFARLFDADAIYKQLGRYERSEALNVHAGALCRSADPLELADSLDALGDVRRYAGKTDQAVAPLQDVTRELTRVSARVEARR